jgi:hypothetical protein
LFKINEVLSHGNAKALERKERKEEKAGGTGHFIDGGF